MVRLFVILGMASTVAACGTIEAINRSKETSFVPLTDKTFRFDGYADALYRLDTAEGEATRLRMLKTWLDQNSMCPAGYAIDQRQVVQRATGALSNVYDVHYTGHCT